MRYQIMDATTWSTYGIYQGSTPKEALEAWAKAHNWGSFDGYRSAFPTAEFSVEGHRIYLKIRKN